MSRRSFARVAVAVAASALLITFATMAAGPQEEKGEARAKDPRRAEPEKKRREKVGDVPAGRSEEEIKSTIAKMIDGFDLKPKPMPAIPDNPPPHEGALIDLPYIVEPPDMLIVEVLETLPGRPISGERLVKADGYISLGFYGEVYVRGLTIPQVKVAIIKHLRKYLSDETLGLETMEEPGAIPLEERATVPPPVVPNAKNPLNDNDEGKSAPAKPRASLGRGKLRTAMLTVQPGAEAIRLGRARRTSQEPDERKAIGQAPQAFAIPFPGQGNVKITIEIQGHGAGGAMLLQPEAVPPPAPEAEREWSWRVVPPQASGAVFVDVTAYNTKNYYILGDVLYPGKLPQTGNETVLDAFQYAGGFLPTADTKDIRLVRPGRNGKPSRVYKVDLEAIQDRGDVRSNYQIFPGDRLIVGRNEVVKTTVAIDRLNAPIQAIVSSIQQNVNMLKSLGGATPEQGDELLKDLVDFWAKGVSRKGDLKFDEQTLREVLLRQLKKPPTAPRPSPTPGAR